MTSAFDEDTAVTPLEGGRFGANVSDRWHIGAAPNGGYLLALVGRAMVEAGQRPDPLTVTAHYHRPPVAGPATIATEVVRRGRTATTVTARLEQDGAVLVSALGAVTDLGSFAGATDVRGAPPDLGPIEEQADARSPVTAIPLQGRVDYAGAPPGFMVGQPSGRMEVGGYVRARDGREPDPLWLLFVVDSLAPTTFETGRFGWVPTLELTVHVRARPAPGWLSVAHRTRFLQDGLMEEDAEVWDSTGRFVAQSCQLALLRE